MIAGTTAAAADVNANWALCVLTDTSRTISVTHTYTASQTLTGGFTAGAACTISTGGLTVTAGGITVTDGGLSVVAGTTAVQALTTTTIVASSSVAAGASSPILWTGRSRAESPSDGVITLMNNGSTDFSRLNFGGATSSFPALKRSGTGLLCRLADDSAAANFTCDDLTVDVIAATGRITTDSTTDATSGTDGSLQTDGGLSVVKKAWIGTGLTVDAGGVTVTAGGLTVTAGGLTVSASGITVTGNSTITGTLSSITTLTCTTATASKFKGNSSAPAIAAGAALGSSPTVSIAGTDSAGVIRMTVGSSPTSGAMVTVTYNSAYAAKPYVVLFPATSAAALALGDSGSRGVFVNDASSSTTAFVVSVVGTGIVAATQLDFYYLVIA